MQGTPPDSRPLRIRICIDGYNFYYGCSRGTPDKWLYLISVFEQRVLPSVLIQDDAGIVLRSLLLPSLSISYLTRGFLNR